MADDTADYSDDSAPAEKSPWDRSRFADELKANPDLQDKILRIAYNEQGAHPEGTQGIIESMMNRANVRGTSLADQARWHESEGGYYQQGNMGRGALENPKIAPILRASLANALGGANTIGYATDNSSGGLAAKEKGNGSFRPLKDINGETFFAPGTAETRHAGTWDSMMAGQPAPAFQTTVPTQVAGAPAPSPAPPQPQGLFSRLLGLPAPNPAAPTPGQTQQGSGWQFGGGKPYVPPPFTPPPIAQPVFYQPQRQYQQYGQFAQNFQSPYTFKGS